MPNPHPTADQAQHFGKCLRALREQRGLSQEAVALEADISLQHLSLLERGLSDQSKQSPANPRLGVLLHLAHALHVDLAALIQPLSAALSEEIARSGGPVDDAGAAATVDLAQPPAIKTEGVPKKKSEASRHRHT